jgi:DNA-binding IclR family transcriptional regulator
MVKVSDPSAAAQAVPPAKEEEGLGSSGATERCFAILEFVARQGHPVSAVEVSEALVLPKPTAYRLIETLERSGFLSRQGSSKRITAGPRLTDLAFSVLRASVRYGPRRQILDSLVREVGETGNIGTIDRNEIVYLDRVEADHWPLRLQFRIGSKVPLYCTAIGKLFLALLPETASRSLIDQIELIPHTPTTLSDRTSLEAELANIRKERFSLDREEYIAGVVCIAAPIFDQAGNIQAAVAIQAPSARMPVERALQYRDALQRAAQQLSDSFNETRPRIEPD